MAEPLSLPRLVKKLMVAEPQKVADQLLDRLVSEPQQNLRKDAVGGPSKSEPTPKKPKEKSGGAAKVLTAINKLKLDTGKAGKDKDDAKEEPSDSATDPDEDDNE